MQTRRREKEVPKENCKVPYSPKKGKKLAASWLTSKPKAASLIGNKGYGLSPPLNILDSSKVET